MFKPAQTLDTLAEWGTANLTQVVAIDSQSNEESDSIPSSEGQRRLSDHLRRFFSDLGYATEQDDFANLIVTVPANLPEGRTCPALALMVHMDTAEGTEAIPALEVVPRWDGGRIPYPANARLQVSAEHYPETRFFVGQDVLHGPGRRAFGLDDKLGMSELMTLAQILKANPDLPHGELVLVFRPDEEIGKMEAVVGLAGDLKRRGVRYGYTVDGITPFELNVENFNASRARVTVEGRPLGLQAAAAERLVEIQVLGCKSHGATAKAEGYLNATAIFARAVRRLGAGDEIVPVDFATDATAETDAVITWLVRGDDERAVDGARDRLLGALGAEIADHRWKGADIAVLDERAVPEEAPLDGLRVLAGHLDAFLRSDQISPLLSEDSEGYQGYSNPYGISRHEGRWTLDYRLRDFDPDGLRVREEHVARICSESAGRLEVEVTPQYLNMGPKMAAYPELVTWAIEALAPLGREPDRDPIRGGTGVDPFLDVGIPVANVGTGYFAAESEKELTSRQSIAEHSLWLANLVQVVASAGSPSP